MRTGRLVRHKNYNWIGLVLCWRYTGRFVPGLELKVRWTTEHGFHTSGVQERDVEYVDADG